MRRCLEAALLLLTLAAPVVAEQKPADCPTLTAALDSFAGYDLTVPPAGPQDGWCVLDGAAFRVGQTLRQTGYACAVWSTVRR